MRPGIAEVLNSGELLTVEFFWQFVDRCVNLTFEDPAAGLEQAKHAPELARLVDPNSDLLAMTAYMILGTAYRAVAEYDRAEEAFAQGTEHASRLDLLETVDLKRRLAYLRLDQRRFDEALELVYEAIRIYRRDGEISDLHFLGKCQIILGSIYYEMGDADRAVIELTTALQYINPRRKAQYYYSAVHNLAVALTGTVHSDALANALNRLKKARKRINGRGLHMAKLKLKWLQGMICNRFGSTRQGERCLLAAYDGLAELGAAFEVALIGLTLGRLYLQEYEPPDVIKKLAEDTYQLCERLSLASEALEALLIWRDADEDATTDALLQSIYIDIASRTKPAIGTTGARAT